VRGQRPVLRALLEAQAGAGVESAAVDCLQGVCTAVSGDEMAPPDGVSKVFRALAAAGVVGAADLARWRSEGPRIRVVAGREEAIAAGAGAA